jgi:uncharacterized protein YicC (UPF0701 family)
MTFRKDEGVSLEKISIAYWEYSTVHDWHFSIGLGTCNYKDRLQTAIDELKVNVDENRFEQELIYYLEKT